MYSYFQKIKLQVFIFFISGIFIQCSQESPIGSLSTKEGTFLVHRRQSLIGKEDFQVEEKGDTIIIRSIQQENERGRISGVTAELRMKRDLTPVYYENIRIANNDTLNILRVASTDSDVTIKELFFDEVSVSSDEYFPLHSNIPAGIEMMLYHYCLAKELNTVKTLPRGEVILTFRQKDTTVIEGKEVILNRYIVEGINWGTRTVWLDEENNLIAVVKANTQFRELVREGYEEAMPLFIAGNVEEQMNVLEGYTQSLRKQQASIKAFVGADVITGLTNTTLKDQTIIIENEIIKGIGPAASVTIPENAEIYDVKGKTFMPGLWDMHAHSNQVQWAPAYLAGGVTTIRDLGNELEFATAFRDAMNSGKTIGPHMLLGGMTDGAGIKGNGVIRATNEKEAIEVVEMYYSHGYNQIKIYNSIEPEVLEVLATEAHKRGMTVTGHVPVAVGNAVDAVKLGMDQFNHRSLFLSVLFPDKKASELGRFYLADTTVTEQQIKSATSFLLENKITLDPTISLDVLRYLPYETPWETKEPDVYRIAYELFEGKRFGRGVSEEQSATATREIEKAMEIIGHFYKAGVPIVAGTDNIVPVFSLYLEIETYHKLGGLSTLEAIRTATSIPAKVMGMIDQTGTLEVGKEADIAILDKNPLDDITNLRTVNAVINNGEYFESAPLWMAADFQAR